MNLLIFSEFFGFPKIGPRVAYIYKWLVFGTSPFHRSSAILMKIPLYLLHIIISYQGLCILGVTLSKRLLIFSGGGPLARKRRQLQSGVAVPKTLRAHSSMRAPPVEVHQPAERGVEERHEPLQRRPLGARGEGRLGAAGPAAPPGPGLEGGALSSRGKDQEDPKGSKIMCQSCDPALWHHARHVRHVKTATFPRRSPLRGVGGIFMQKMGWGHRANPPYSPET